MAPGYSRLTLERCGAGASETWTAVLHGFDREAGSPQPVGEVIQVFDRSAYLEFAPGPVSDAGLLGPPVVLLGGPAFDGPLATQLAGTGPGGFNPRQLTPGDSCQLRSGVRSEAGDRYVLAIGDPLDVAIDPAALTATDTARGTFHGLGSITPDGDAYRRAAKALDLFAAQGIEDGLGWLDELRRLVAGERPDDDLGELIDWWSTLLGSADPPPGVPPDAILGRGPGATPSGDDVVSGLLLALDRTTAGDRRRRVGAAAESVVGRATDRTTTVSAALLAQAAQGRATGRIEAAIAALLGTDASGADWESAVLAADDVGHSSGVDILVGAMVVALGIGPRVGTAE